MAEAAAKMALESLLRARKLDVTLTSAHPLIQSIERTLPTGLVRLDCDLGGGLPRGELSEVIGPRSSGRTSLLCRLMASTTRDGELAAFVDTFDTFDPASAAAAGVDLSRVLWIRAPPVDRSLKALHLVLQSGGFSLAAFDLTDAPPSLLRTMPFPTWFRIARTIEGSRTACVLLAAAHIARSPGGVTVALSGGGSSSGRWTGTSARARLFRGLDVDARVISSRRG